MTARFLGFLPDQVDLLRVQIQRLDEAATYWRTPVDEGAPAALRVRLRAFMAAWLPRLDDILERTDLVDQYADAGVVLPGDQRSWTSDPLDGAAPAVTTDDRRDPEADYDKTGGFLTIGSHKVHNASVERSFVWMTLYAGADSLPHPADVAQGADGDCWLLAALASAAQVDPERVARLVSDNGDGTYTVHLRSGDQHVDGDLYVRQSGGVAYERGGALWAAVVEKAYAQAHGGYHGIDGGQQTNAFHELFDVRTRSVKVHAHEDEAAFAAITAALESGRPVTASTKDKHMKIVGGGHAWSVLAVSTNPVTDERFVTVRNPWGKEPDGLEDADHVSDPNDPGVTRVPLSVFTAQFSDLQYVTSW